MRIAYIGRVTLPRLSGSQAFDRQLPDVRWGFPLGSEIVNRLVARGHEVHVITEHLVDKIERYSAGTLTVWLVPSRKRSRWSFLTFFAKEVRGIEECLVSISPDVVFAQWCYYNALAALRSGFPSLVVAHDSPWRVAATSRNLQSLIKAVFAQVFVFPKLKHVTAVSPHIAGDLHRLNHYKGEIPVIPNGMKMEMGPGKIIRRRAKTIVCVSQTGRLKNTKVLIRAFEISRMKHADWKLLLFGQGMPNGIRSREEIDQILREEADVFCSPSLEESFGMVFVEAMRLGVPCVGGEKSGAVPWVLGCCQSGDSCGGVVCDVTKPDELVGCIEHLMDDWEFRKKLSVGGIRRVKEMFDIERVVDTYENELAGVAELG